MKGPWTRLLQKLGSFADIPKLLENLTSAVRTAADKLSAEIRVPEETEQDRKNEQARQYRVQRCIARGTWATFVAGSVYALIAWFQWNDAHKQMLNTSRAWLGYQTQDDNLPVIVDRVQVVPKLIVAAHYAIKNFGNGPAIKVIPTFFVVTDKDLTLLKRTEAFICDSSKAFSTGTVPMASGVFNPGPMGFVLFPTQSHADSATWSGDAMPDLKWLYVTGCVSYLDQFKTWHWTRFSVLVGDGINQISDASPKKLYTLFNDTDETGAKDPF